MINVNEINSAGIRNEARRDGITFIEELGNNGKTGDARITVYKVGSVRVADTNGDPVWEESDSEAFAELLTSEGISLGFTSQTLKKFTDAII